MKYVTLLALFLTSRSVLAQACTEPNCTGSPSSAWCRTASRADYRDANGRFCDMCSPNQGQCLAASGDDCVNDCRACHDGAGGTWFQDVISNCVTSTTPYAQLCQLCAPGILQAVSCDAFYCGAIDAIHCRARDCFTCP